MDNYTLNASTNLTNTTLLPSIPINATLESIATYSNNSSITMVMGALNRIDPLYILVNLVNIAIILLLTFIMVKIAEKMLDKYFIRLAGWMLKGRLIQAEIDKTTQLLIRRLTVASIYVVGVILIILQIPPLSSLAVAMLAGAGIAGVVIGFAAKDSLANMISGISIVVFSPFKVGDTVEFRGFYGQIEDLTLRHTVLCTDDNRRVVIPNSMMSSEYIINWSIKDPISTFTVDFAIGYSADIDRVREIMIEEANSHPDVMKDRRIAVRMIGFGESAVNVRLYMDFPRRDVAFTAACEIRESIKKRLDGEGIELPYPYRNVILSNRD